jgi:hypothetical protein
MIWKQRVRSDVTQLLTLVQASGSQASLFAEAPVNRNGVVVPEVFDNHEEHESIP